MDTFTRIGDLLRGRTPPTSGSSLLRSLAWVVLFGGAYGAVMGTFGGVSEGRYLQMAFSAVKVPFLLIVTFLLSLPSFAVLNTLFGVRSDLGRVLGTLASSQAGLTVILTSLAPFTVFWYLSSADYTSAILFNALLFGLSSLAAQGLLLRSYRPLIAQNARHRVLLRVWLVIYAFVGIQMGWVLRPFVGSPTEPVSFFRPDAWGNAYLVILQLISRKF